MSRLLSLHDAVGILVTTIPETLAHREVAKAIEQELVRALIACLTGPVSRESVPRVRGTVMQRFEQVIEAHGDEPIYLTDVCAAVGVTERTLRYYCQERLGMSPHRYLQLRRMHLVRRALKIADPATTTVTIIANNYGFGELGRFSAAYRRMFGETPSMTLRRSP
jgi:AraC-like DNA-binding protein